MNEDPDVDAVKLLGDLRAMAVTAVNPATRAALLDASDVLDQAMRTGNPNARDDAKRAAGAAIDTARGVRR